MTDTLLWSVGSRYGRVRVTEGRPNSLHRPCLASDLSHMVVKSSPAVRGWRATMQDPHGQAANGDDEQRIGVRAVRDTGSTTGVATAVLALLGAGTLAGLGMVTAGKLRDIGPARPDIQQPQTVRSPGAVQVTEPPAPVTTPGRPRPGTAARAPGPTPPSRRRCPSTRRCPGPAGPAASPTLSGSGTGTDVGVPAVPVPTVPVPRPAADPRRPPGPGADARGVGARVKKGKADKAKKAKKEKKKEGQEGQEGPSCSARLARLPPPGSANGCSGPPRGHRAPRQGTRQGHRRGARPARRRCPGQCCPGDADPHRHPRGPEARQRHGQEKRTSRVCVREARRTRCRTDPCSYAHGSSPHSGWSTVPPPRSAMPAATSSGSSPSRAGRRGAAGSWSFPWGPAQGSSSRRGPRSDGWRSDRGATPAT